jgi:hypothetical protein
MPRPTNATFLTRSPAQTRPPSVAALRPFTSLSTRKSFSSSIQAAQPLLRTRRLLHTSRPPQPLNRPSRCPVASQQLVILTQRPKRRYIHVLPRRRQGKEWPYLYKDFDTMPHLPPFFEKVDELKEGFINRLAEAVAIPSISSEDARRGDVVKVSCAECGGWEHDCG